MFDSLHITYLLKTICEDNEVEVLPDTVELPKHIYSFKTNLNDFRNSLQSGKVKKISFFSIEPLSESIQFTMDNDFIIRCIVQ